MQQPAMRGALRPPVAVISPHLDDAVLACGEQIASHPGSTVITVFAGGPTQWGDPTGWDRAAGFKPGEDVLAARRAEDQRSLEALGAVPLWLHFLDSQYGASPGLAEVAAALRKAVSALRAGTVLAPLGLFHSDHVLASDAALQALRPSPGETDAARPDLLLYEDALYRQLKGLVQSRAAALAGRAVILTPATSLATADDVELTRARKRRAVECYASQLRALATPGRLGHEDAFDPERYWKVAFAVAPEPGA